MSDKFIKHKKLKCKNCGRYIGMLGFPECASGVVACEYIPVTNWKDTLVFLKMDMQDIAWRLGEAMKREDREAERLYRRKLSSHLDEILRIHSSFQRHKI